MFVRKNRNRSGSTSVQIISKENGSYRVIKTIGTSKYPDEIEKLVIEAKDQINHPDNQTSLFPILSEADATIENFMDKLSNTQIRTIGPELIFGKLFDRLGYNVIKDKLFRHITIARLVYPTSKLKTVDYLYRYQGVQIEVVTVYRFLDRLRDKYKEKVEQIAYEHLTSTLQHPIITA